MEVAPTDYGRLLGSAAEPEKLGETRSYEAFCASSSVAGSLIQAMALRRCRHRCRPALVGQIGGVKGFLALGTDLARGAVVDRCGRMVRNAGLAMLVVVVAEEPLAEGPGGLEGAEPAGEGREFFMV